MFKACVSLPQAAVRCAHPILDYDRVGVLYVEIIRLKLPGEGASGWDGMGRENPFMSSFSLLNNGFS